MERIRSLDDYLQRKEALRRFRADFTNNYMMNEDAARLIALDRLYCITNEAGTFFLSDEDTHYRISMHVDTGKNHQLPSLDKPIVTQMVYQKDKKKEGHQKVERWLEKNGFVKQDTAVQVKLDVTKYKAEYQKKFERLHKLLQRMGHEIKVVDVTYRDKIREVFLQQDMLHDWYYPFQTEEEIKETFDRNGWICILDQDDRVLAYHSAYEINSCCYGMGFIVRNEYQIKYGFAPILQYYRVCITEHPLIRGEVLLHNAQSMALHKTIGWTFTNRYTDRWLKE